MIKKSFYLSVAVFVIVSALYVYRFININKSLNERQFNFDLPEIATIERGKINSATNLLNYSYAWGDQPNPIASKVATSASTTGNQNKYIYKRVNGVPAICSTVNTKNRWEFYGISHKDNATLAVFYNPFLKIIKAIEENKDLDNGLIIDRIGSDEVYVKYKKRVFALKIFNFTRSEKK